MPDGRWTIEYKWLKERWQWRGDWEYYTQGCNLTRLMAEMKDLKEDSTSVFRLRNLDTGDIIMGDIL